MMSVVIVVVVNVITETMRAGCGSSSSSSSSTELGQEKMSGWAERWMAAVRCANRRTNAGLV